MFVNSTSKYVSIQSYSLVISISFVVCTKCVSIILYSIGYLFGHGGVSELIFVTFHEFLTYVYEKYVILKLSDFFMIMNICGVAQQYLGELEVACSLY